MTRDVLARCSCVEGDFDRRHGGPMFYTREERCGDEYRGEGAKGGRSFTEAF